MDEMLQQIENPFGELKWVKDLQIIEVPLVTQFLATETDETVLFRWIDIDDGVNRWVAVSVSQEKLTQYFDGHVSLREVTTPESDHVFLVDTDSSNKFVRFWRCTYSDLPEDCKPSSDLFFDDQLLPRY